MPASYFADVAADVTLSAAAETVVATVTGVTSQRGGQTVELEGQVNVTGGTSTTAYVLRIREDGLAGNVVDEVITDTLDAAVGSAEDHIITARHAPAGELSGKSYVLTVSQTSGAASGTVNHARLRADVTP